jgi:hypothetical protein
MEGNDLLVLTVFAASGRCPVAFYRAPAEQQSETSVRYACMFQLYAQLRNKLACINKVFFDESINKVIDALQE